MTKDVKHIPAILNHGEAERLVHAYSDLILRLSYTYLKSTDDVQDTCQTVFLKLLQKSRASSSPEYEEAQIVRTAVNLCKSHLKNGWRRTTVAPDAAEAVPAPVGEEGSLLSAVNLLPPKHRTVIHLYYYEGYAAWEIVQLLGEKPAAISTQLNRGRQQLHTLSEGEGMT